MNRVIHVVVAASAIGLVTGGVALACEQHMTQNEQGATVEKGKLALLGNGIAAPEGQVVRGEDEEKSGDEKSSEEGK
jgi:hypothetical protein